MSTKSAHEELKEWTIAFENNTDNRRFASLELIRRAVAEHEVMKRQLEDAKLPTVEHVQDIYELSSVKEERDQLKAALEQSEKCCAEMREALEKLHGELYCGCSDGAHIYGCPKCRIKRDIIEPALSSDCGKGYASPEQVRVLKEALESFRNADGCFCEASFGMNDGSHPRHSDECQSAQQALDLCKKLEEK